LSIFTCGEATTILTEGVGMKMCISGAVLAIKLA
jgi:hypothetical protein